MPSNTFSSVKEALASAFSAPVSRRRASTNDVCTDNAPPATGNGNGGGRAVRRGSYGLSQSFTTAGITAGTRIHRADTRSSFADIAENCDYEDTTIITIEGICLSGSPPSQELDLSVMTDEDLKRLKAEDPFMYYSIPEVHQRAYRFEDDEDAAARGNDRVPLTIHGGTNLHEDDDFESSGSHLTRHDDESSCAAGPPPPRAQRMARRGSAGLAASCPAGMLANAEIARASLLRSLAETATVTKRRRLSAEAHPTVVCSELMHRQSSSFSEMDEENEGEGGEDTADLEDRFLESMILGALGDDSDEEYDNSDGDEYSME